MTSFTEFQHSVQDTYVTNREDRILFDDLTGWTDDNDTIFPEEEPDKPYGGGGSNPGNSGGDINTGGGDYQKDTDELEEYIEKIEDTKENTAKNKSPLLLVAALLIGIISLKK